MSQYILCYFDKVAFTCPATNAGQKYWLSWVEAALGSAYDPQFLTKFDGGGYARPRISSMKCYRNLNQHFTAAIFPCSFIGAGKVASTCPGTGAG